MKKFWFPLSIAIAALWLAPSSAFAAAVYVTGNTCPASPLDADFTGSIRSQRRRTVSMTTRTPISRVTIPKRIST